MTLIHQKFRILGKKGEGTFSEVLKCQNISDGTYWACKKMKQSYDSIEQVNNLREIQAMRRLAPHAHILELHEVIFEKKTGNLSLILELMDMNIYELIRGKRHYLPERQVKHYMYQLLKAIEHTHRNGIFHRDVKPENILIKEDQLKLADFGSCRSVYSKQPYTEYISTRWYRAPECLLTDGYYTYKMDIWSVGCVMFEVLTLHPLFPGSNEVDQIAKIHDVMGTPEPSILNKFRKSRALNFNFPAKKGTGIERLLTHVTPDTIDLILRMCEYDPDDRITARQALKHSYFKELRDADRRAANQSNTDAPQEQTRRTRPKLERYQRDDVPPATHHSEEGLESKTIPEVTAYPNIPKAQSLPSHTNENKDPRRRRRKRTNQTYQYSNHTGLLPRVKMHNAKPPYYPNATSLNNPLLNTSKYGYGSSQAYLPEITNSLSSSQKPPKNSNKYGYYGQYLKYG